MARRGEHLLLLHMPSKANLACPMRCIRSSSILVPQFYAITRAFVAKEMAAELAVMAPHPQREGHAAEHTRRIRIVWDELGSERYGSLAFHFPHR
jgi:hypothetical protein